MAENTRLKAMLKNDPRAFAALQNRQASAPVNSEFMTAVGKEDMSPMPGTPGSNKSFYAPAADVLEYAKILGYDQEAVKQQDELAREQMRRYAESQINGPATLAKELVSNWTGNKFQEDNSFKEAAKILAANEQKKLDEMQEGNKFALQVAALGKGSQVSDFEKMAMLAKALGSGAKEKSYDKFESDLTKLDDSLIGFESTLDNLDTALASGDPKQIQPALSAAARTISMEKGALSNKDVARQLQRTFNTDIANIENYFGGKSTYSPEDLRGLVALSKAARKSMREVTLERINRRTETYGRTPGRDTGTAKEIASPVVDRISALKEQDMSPAEKIQKQIEETRKQIEAIKAKKQ